SVVTVRVRVKNFDDGGTIHYAAKNVKVQFGTSPGRFMFHPVAPFPPGVHINPWSHTLSLDPGQMVEFEIPVLIPPAVKQRLNWLQRLFRHHAWRRCYFSFSATVFTSSLDISTADNTATWDDYWSASPGTFEIANHVTNGQATFNFVYTPQTPNSQWTL